MGDILGKAASCTSVCPMLDWLLLAAVAGLAGWFVYAMVRLPSRKVLLAIAVTDVVVAVALVSRIVADEWIISPWVFPVLMLVSLVMVAAGSLVKLFLLPRSQADYHENCAFTHYASGDGEKAAGHASAAATLALEFGDHGRAVLLQLKARRYRCVAAMRQGVTEPRSNPARLRELRAVLDSLAQIAASGVLQGSITPEDLRSEGRAIREEIRSMAPRIRGIGDPRAVAELVRVEADDPGMPDHCREVDELAAREVEALLWECLADKSVQGLRAHIDGVRVMADRMESSLVRYPFSSGTRWNAGDVREVAAAVLKCVGEWHAGAASGFSGTEEQQANKTRYVQAIRENLV